MYVIPFLKLKYPTPGKLEIKEGFAYCARNLDFIL